MSLIKNESTDGIKVSTLSAITVEDPYSGSDIDCNIKEYVTMHGSTFIKPFLFSTYNDAQGRAIVDTDLRTYFKYKDTVLIKGEYKDIGGLSLFGYQNATNKRMAIFCNGEYITWWFGTGKHEHDLLCAGRPAQSGVHLFGWVDGKPYYDGEFLDFYTNWKQELIESENITGEESFDSKFELALTGLYEQKLWDNLQNESPDQGFCVRATKLYRVIIHLSETDKTYSYYPCATSDNLTIRMYEALTTGRFCDDDGVHNVVQESNSYCEVPTANITYGVSLTDLKAITGSKYKDLLAIVTEDSGLPFVPSGESSDYTYKISKDNIIHEFAFCLRDVSIPLGATAQNSLSSYKKGELIYGRRPKWNIWANSMPYSVWNRPDLDYNGYYDSNKKLYAMYNIMEHWGKDGKVNLMWFNGYCAEEYNKPEIQFIYEDGTPATENIEIHYHNEVPCYCDTLSIMPSISYDADSNDELHSGLYNIIKNPELPIYKYNNALPNSSVTMKLGNAANWNATKQLQVEADPLTYSDGTIAYDHGSPQYTFNLLIYGMTATLTHEFLTLIQLGNSYEYGKVKVLIGYATEQTKDKDNSGYLIPLSSQSSQAEKLKFREGKIYNSETHLYDKLHYEKLRATGNEERRLYNEIKAAINKRGQYIYQIEAVGSLALFKNDLEVKEEYTPRNRDLVYLNKFIAPTKLHIRGVFDSDHEISGEELTLYYKTFAMKNPPGGDYQENRVYSGQGAYVKNDSRVIYMGESNNFLPIGFENEIYLYKHLYDNYYYDGSHALVIPFVFTKYDFTTYKSIADFYKEHEISTYVKDPTDGPSLVNALRFDQTLLNNIIPNIGLSLYVEAELCGIKTFPDDSPNEYFKARIKVPVLNPKINDIIGSDDFTTGTNNFLGIDLGTNSNSNNRRAICIYATDFNTKFKHCDSINQSIELAFSKDEYENFGIPSNGQTLKFWVTNNSYPIVQHNRLFLYNSVNDSWYKCIFGGSLYVFIKDLQNNDWRYYGCKEVMSVWLYGKKVNMFTFSETLPSTPTGGTYASPLSSSSGWTDSIPNSDSLLSLWMSERFYAKIGNYNNIPSGQPSSYSLVLCLDIYRRHVEETIFTDLTWSTPVEIKDDVDNKPMILLALVNDEHYNTIYNDIENNPENFYKYFKYIEETKSKDEEEGQSEEIETTMEQGFYGILSENNDLYALMCNVYILSNAGEYDLDFKYFDESINFSDIFKKEDNFERIADHYGWNYDNLDVYDIVISHFTFCKIVLDKDLNIIGNIEKFKIEDDGILIEAKLNRFSSVTRAYHSLLSSYNSELLKENYEWGLNNTFYNYSILNKYLFSKTFLGMPSENIDNWITLDELYQLSGAEKSLYQYIYHEKLLFNFFGQYHKVFNVIEILNEHDTDLFIPLTDVTKIDLIGTATNYYIGGYSDASKYPYFVVGPATYYYLSSSLVRLHGNNIPSYGIDNIIDQDKVILKNPYEILAPYTINGLNVSVKDIILFDFKPSEIYNPGGESSSIGLNYDLHVETIETKRIIKNNGDYESLYLNEYYINRVGLTITRANNTITYYGVTS